jgi:hypothetical protein
MTECPHCHAVLPQPPDRFCPNCGADLTAGAAGGGFPPPPGPPPAGDYPPAGGYPPSGGYPPPGGLPPGFGGLPPGGQTPWERRNQIGFFNALVETTKQVLSRPSEFFRAMPVVGGVGGPLLYGVIVGYLGLVASTIYNAVFQSVIGSSIARMGSGSEFERLAPFLQGGAGLVANLIFGPVFLAIGLFVVSGIIHLVLLAMGGAARGYEATFRVAAYSEAAAIFNIVPMCGGVIGAIYMIVLVIIGVSEAQGISRGKAAAAVLVPILILCCCCGGIVAIAVGGLAGALNRMN